MKFIDLNISIDLIKGAFEFERVFSELTEKEIEGIAIVYASTGGSGSGGSGGSRHDHLV